MSSVDYALDNARRVEIARAALDAWRGIGRAQVRGALLFGCALFAYHIIVFSNWIFTRAPRPILSLSKAFLMEQLGAFILMLVLVATDRITDGDPRRRATYAVAVVVSAMLYTPLLTLIDLLSEFTWIEFVKGTLYSFFEWVVLAGVATFIYTDRRRARAALARMRTAEVERAHAAKRTLESRLQAMQARVEPQFLFNTLAQVRDLYRASAVRGERMLDELIAYLRAAMPRMRDTSSTVGQEIDLLRAYLGIVSLRLGERLGFDIDLPGEAAYARMPPMMLLPLVDHAIAHGLADPCSTGSICIRTAVADEKIRLEIVDSGIGFLPGSEDDGIAGIRERLSALYGNDASLVLRRKEASASEAVLEIRYELGDAPLEER
jgi:signal transduction histidine kinase